MTRRAYDPDRYPPPMGHRSLLVSLGLIALIFALAFAANALRLGIG